MSLRKQIPKEPRAFVLFAISQVESEFAKKQDGDEIVRKACEDMRAWINKEWTLEREQQLIAQEKARWNSASEEAVRIVGKGRWTELENMGREMKDNMENAHEHIQKDFLEYEAASPHWKELTTRLREAAAKGAEKKNVIQIANDARSRLLSYLTQVTEKDESVVADVLRGKIAIGSVAERLLLEASKHIGIPSDGKDEDKIAALGALVRYKNDAQSPITVASLLVRVSDAAPYCLIESKKFEEAMSQKPGAKHYIDIAVKKSAEVLDEQRVKLILEHLNALDPNGGKDTLGKFARAVADKDYVTMERIAKSTVLEWTTTLLPQLDLPPIEGVRDGVRYTVKGMDLSHFHLDERNMRIIVKSALGQVLRGDPIVKIVIDDLSATIKDMKWSFAQEYFPYMTGQGIAHAEVKGLCIVLGFQLVKRTRGSVQRIVETVTGESAENGEEQASPATASSTASAKQEEFVPQLIMGISRVTVDSVKLDLESAAIYSMLTEVFAKTIRTYVASLIQDIVVEKVSPHLEKANEGFAMHGWEALSSAFEIDAFRLPTEEVAARRAEQLEAPLGGRKDLYSVTFNHEGPMGLALGKWNEFVVVKSFKKAKDGSVLPAESSGRIKIGDILVGFNGAEITSLPLDRVTMRISRSRRPLTLSFAPGDVHSMEATKKRNHMCKYNFVEDKLFLLIKARPTEDKAAVVTGFRPTKPEGGGEGPAEKAGVPVGWVLAGINNQSMLDKSFKDTMQIFQSTTARPVELKFVRDPELVIELNESPVDLKLASFDNGMVVVSGFSQLKSPAESLLGDQVQSGDFIVGIGAKDTTLMKFDDTIDLIRKASRPVEIRFGRSNINGITAAGSFGSGPLGMVFYRSSNEGKCCFKAFQGIEGPVERLKQILPGNVLRTVNGVTVTSEQQARELLAKPTFPLKLGFRDMEAYEAGGWKA